MNFHKCLENYLAYIKEEVNVGEIICEYDEEQYIEYKATPKHKNLGQRL